MYYNNHLVPVPLYVHAFYSHISVVQSRQLTCMQYMFGMLHCSYCYVLPWQPSASTPRPLATFSFQDTSARLHDYTDYQRSLFGG